MATPPYSQGQPFVEPAATPPQDYQHVDANPAEFGGQLAQGGEKLGQGLETATRFYGQIAAQQAVNDWQDNTNKILYGDPGVPGDTGYYGLKGQAAMDAMPDVIERMKEAQETGIHSLALPVSQSVFSNDVRFLRARHEAAVGQHYDQQAQSWAVGVNQSTADLRLRDIQTATLSGDPAAIGHAQDGLTQARIREAQVKFGTNLAPEMTKDIVTKARGDSATAQIETLAPTNPSRAMQILDANKDVILGPKYDTLYRELQARSAQSDGSQAARGAFQSAYGAGSNTGPIANKTLPAEAQRFLPALSGGEGNYNSPAPRGDQSATPIGGNRYQFLNSTWQGAAPAAGVDPNDKSPANQDAVAWDHAQSVYKANTGGNLQADIAAGGNEAKIAGALNKVWPSLPGGSEQNTTLPQFAARMQNQQATTNDARGPIPGDSRRQAMQSIMNNPALSDPARTHALQQLEQYFSMDDRAAHADAEAAFGDWVPKVRLDPSSVDPTAIKNDPRLTGEQKDHLLGMVSTSQNNSTKAAREDVYNQVVSSILAAPSAVTDDTIIANKALNGEEKSRLFALRTTAQNERDRTYSDTFKAASEQRENQLGSQIMADPTSVSPIQIASDGSLDLARKIRLQNLLDATKKRSATPEGVPYTAALQSVFSPPGTPGHINTVSDIYPLMSQGLTAAGADKLHNMIKLRDAPDGPVMAAAVPAWKMAIERTTKEIPGISQPVTPASAASFARFTADLPGIIADAKAHNMTMAQIVADGGPIAKVLPNYMLSNTERMQSLAGGTPPVTGQPGAGSAMAPSLTVGQWYARGPGGSFVPAQPGTPNARVYRGGPATGNPGSWEVPAAPTAPH